MPDPASPPDELPPRGSAVARVEFIALDRALSSVGLDGLPALVAGEVVGVLERSTGAPVRIDVPESSPAAGEFGNPGAEVGTVVRFPVSGGEGSVRFGALLDLDPSELAAVSDRMQQIWRSLEGRARQDAELSQTRFHLQALEQMAATTAVVRELAGTEKLALDSAREIFFAWWAVLYRFSDGTYSSSTTVSAREGIESHRIPAEALEEVGEGDGPRILDDPVELSDALPEPPAVLIPLRLDDGERALIALGSRMTDQPYTPDDLGLLAALAHNITTALRNAALVRDLKRAATVDPLTACLNRRGFDARIAIELTRADRYDRPLSLILLDLDGFKALNDAHGHQTGDVMLHRVGATLDEAVRDTDIAARFGGEEFAVILPETDAADAAILAERLRRAIETIELPAGVSGPLTASFGVADYPARSTDEATLVQAADQALYAAKKGGRNRVFIAS